MNIQRLNKLLAHGRLDAEGQLATLERAYKIALQTAGRHASERFLTLSVEHLTADATNPGWSPPENDQLFDQDTIAADARKQAAKAHERALKAILAPVLTDMGIAYDLTNPFVARLLDGLGARAQDMGDAVRNDIAKSILASYQEGLSVTDAAKAIESAVDDISPVRAAMLARTDLVGLANGASLAAAQEVVGDGEAAMYKQWLATEDERTRETHAEADGQVVPIDQPFQVGSEEAMYPGDPDLSDEEAANCRCTLVYLDASEAVGALAASGGSPTDGVTSQGHMAESPDDTLTADVTITVGEDTDEAAAMAEPVRWQAVLCVEGEATEDGRMLEPGAITWRETPLSLGVMFETPHAYEASAEIGGRIDRIWRDGNLIRGEGIFTGDEVGQRAAQMVADLTLRGISVDLGVLAYELREADPPVATDDTDDTADQAGDIADVITEIDNLLFVVTDGVIGAATVCPYQAIAGATISVVADGGEPSVVSFVRATSFEIIEPQEPLTAAAEDDVDPRVVAALDKLQAATLPDRMRGYQIGMETGVLCLNDCLKMEGKPPIEGGDEHAVPLPINRLAQISEQLEAISASQVLTASVLETVRQHEQQTEALVAAISALTEKVTAGERVDEAMIETLRSLTGPRDVKFVRDANGRLTGLES